MKYRFLILFALIVCIVSCSGNLRKGSMFRAVERGDVEVIGNRAGLIRTVYCDLYIQNLNIDARKRLADMDCYRGYGRDFPAEPCFQFIVSNTWNRPILIEKITLRYDSENHDPEFFDYISDPGYREKRFAFNLNSMRQYRRLLSDNELIEDINYSKETIEYRSDFIAPGDKILFFRFFPYIPDRKDIKIYITIKYFDIKKIIDFDISRFDYIDE